MRYELALDNWSLRWDELQQQRKTWMTLQEYLPGHPESSEAFHERLDREGAGSDSMRTFVKTFRENPSKSEPRVR